MAKALPQHTLTRIVRTEIVVDDALNSRQTSGEEHEYKIKKLSESFKVQGIMNPPLVMRAAQAGEKYAKKGNYVLVAGFRRHAAMDELALTEADYLLAPSSWTLQDAAAANMVENLNREDLTTYETAMSCKRMSDAFDMKGEDIAKAVRSFDSNPEGKKAMSGQHVNNLIRLATELHKTILAAWKDGHPRASLRVLLKLAAIKNEQEQLQAWKALTEPKVKAAGEKGGGAGGDKDPEKKGKGGSKARPTAQECTLAAERIKASKMPKAWKDGAMVALAWAAGEGNLPKELAAKPAGKGSKKGGPKGANGASSATGGVELEDIDDGEDMGPDAAEELPTV